MLQDSRLNPEISAYTYIFGNYDFKYTPITPPGTKVVVHSKPYQRLTWDLNGESVCYVGPPMKHYRCVQCYFTRTNQVCDCDTVNFISHEWPFSEVKLEYIYLKLENDIITLLSVPPPTTEVSLEAIDPTWNVLLKIADNTTTSTNWRHSITSEGERSFNGITTSKGQVKSEQQQ